MHSLLQDFAPIVSIFSWITLPLTIPLNKVIWNYFDIYLDYINNEDVFDEESYSFLNYRYDEVKRWVRLISKERRWVLFQWIRCVFFFKKLFFWNYFLSYKNNFFKKRSLNSDHLRFIFFKKRFTIALTSVKGRLFFFLTPNLFIKFFKKNKAFKKNKLLKIITVRTVRKFLILSNLPSIFFLLKGSQVLLLELMKVLFSPIIRSFKNPFSDDDDFIVETEKFKFRLNFIYLIFYQNYRFNVMKTRKKGRIKRKLKRKIIALNNIID